MKRILCSLLVATLPFGSVLADAPKSKNAKVTLVYQYELPMSELVARYLKATNDPREVVSDPQARYFGTRLDDRSLVPGGHAHLGTIRLEEWLRQPRAR
jgi:hypothetical protein